MPGCKNSILIDDETMTNLEGERRRTTRTFLSHDQKWKIEKQKLQ